MCAGKMRWAKISNEERPASEGGPYKGKRNPRAQRRIAVPRSVKTNQEHRLKPVLPGPSEGGRYALLHAVVGGFFGDDYVVDVGFAEACGGDADEFAFFGEFFQGAGADVAHAAFQAADELIG